MSAASDRQEVGKPPQLLRLEDMLARVEDQKHLVPILV
jgi:hypothetical protein